LVRDLEARGRAVIDELRRRPEPVALSAFVREARAAIGGRESALEPAPAAGRAPRPGDTVEVVGRGIRGELVELAGPRARIQRGGMRFEVPADQLRVVGDTPAARERIAVAVARPEQAADEINLVGRRVGEAVEALGAFLDRAMRSGASEVRIVHGIGSGALRRAVQELLSSSPYCAGFREADAGAGGAGVTIAELA
jgi:DNA mismatch repair protein MutS2